MASQTDHARLSNCSGQAAVDTKQGRLGLAGLDSQMSYSFKRDGFPGSSMTSSCTRSFRALDENKRHARKLNLKVSQTLASSEDGNLQSIAVWAGNLVRL